MIFDHSVRAGYLKVGKTPENVVRIGFMRVLLIGGCGFIGSHIADCLLAAGISVRVLDKRPEAFRPPLDRVEYVLGDIQDTSLLSESAENMDAIVHLASTTVPTTANLDPVADVTGNLISMLRLLEALRGRPLRKFVFLSSGGTVYGVPDCVPIPEEHALRPINSYGITKVAIENFLFMEHRQHGFQNLILRASNPYGPRQFHTGVQGIIGTHLWRVAQGQAPEVWGDGSVVRDFIHVRDLAQLCYAALVSDYTGCVNAGSGEGTAIIDLVADIQRVVAASGHGEVTPVFKPGRSIDVPRVVLDIGKARQLLGWQPRIGLTEGLEETWAWVRGQAGAT